MSLSSFKTSAGWSRADKSLRDKFGKDGLAKAFIDTIKKLEDATNKPTQFHEWRATKIDTNPPTSNNWEYIRSNFRINLQSETTAADQILNYQDVRNRDNRLSWDNPRDRELIQLIKDSPLPPCISLDGTRKEYPTHTRNATGITVWVCNEFPDNEDWDSGTWANIVGRFKF